MKIHEGRGIPYASEHTCLVHGAGRRKTLHTDTFPCEKIESSGPTDRAKMASPGFLKPHAKKDHLFSPGQ